MGEEFIVKLLVKKQLREFVEFIKFPMIIYSYETGKLIASNQLAKELIGENVTNVNKIWEGGVKQRFSAELLENGSGIYFRKYVYRKEGKIEIDIEFSSIPIGERHMIIGIFEQSYKQPFFKDLTIQLPRIKWKNKKLDVLGVNTVLTQDMEIAKEDFYVWNKSEMSSEIELLKEKKVQTDVIQPVVWKKNQRRFAKVNRFPLTNKNGTAVGMLIIYQIILEKEEYHQLFNSTLRVNNILSEAIGQSNMIVVSRQENDTMPVEYISSNISRLGYHVHEFYSGEVTWIDIIYKEDREAFFKWIKQGSYGNKFLHQEYRILKKNGEIAWIRDEMLGITICGDISYRQSIIKDITEEKLSRFEGVTIDDSKKEIEELLRKAEAKEYIEFDVYYQPIVESGTKKVIAAESLLRWKNPEKGFINPVEFISVSEYLGMIGALGDVVFREAFTMCRTINKHIDSEFKMHINLSTIQLTQPDIVEHICKFARETRVKKSNIVFEVKESLAIEDMRVMQKVLIKLKQQGFFLLLDDFGIGKSSLGTLTELPFDYIKIDKSFMKAYETEQFNPNLLTAIVDLAHSLKIKVIISGIETKQQKEFLLMSDIDEYQGYYFGYPVEKDKFTFGEC